MLAMFQPRLRSFGAFDHGAAHVSTIPSKPQSHHGRPTDAVRNSRMLSSMQQWSAASKQFASLSACLFVPSSRSIAIRDAVIAGAAPAVAAFMLSESDLAFAHGATEEKPSPVQQKIDRRNEISRDHLGEIIETPFASAFLVDRIPTGRPSYSDGHGAAGAPKMVLRAADTRIAAARDAAQRWIKDNQHALMESLADVPAAKATLVPVGSINAGFDVLDAMTRSYEQVYQAFLPAGAQEVAAEQGVPLIASGNKLGAVCAPGANLIPRLEGSSSSNELFRIPQRDGILRSLNKLFIRPHWNSNISIAEAVCSPHPKSFRVAQGACPGLSTAITTVAVSDRSFSRTPDSAIDYNSLLDLDVPYVSKLSVFLPVAQSMHMLELSVPSAGSARNRTRKLLKEGRHALWIASKVNGIEPTIFDFDLPHLKKNPYEIAPVLASAGWSLSEDVVRFDPVLDQRQENSMIFQRSDRTAKLQALIARMMDKGARHMYLKEGLHQATRQQLLGGSIVSSDLSRKKPPEQTNQRHDIRNTWRAFPGVGLWVRRPASLRLGSLEDLYSSPRGSANKRSEDDTFKPDDSVALVDSILATYMTSTAAASGAERASGLPVPPLLGFEPHDFNGMELPHARPQRSAARTALKYPAQEHLPSPSPSIVGAGDKSPVSTLRPAMSPTDAAPLESVSKPPSTPVRPATGTSRPASVRSHMSVSSTSRHSSRTNGSPTVGGQALEEGVACSATRARERSESIVSRLSAQLPSVSSTTSSVMRHSTPRYPVIDLCDDQSHPIVAATRLLLCDPELVELLEDFRIDPVDGVGVSCSVAPRRLNSGSNVVRFVEVDRESVVAVVNGERMTPAESKAQGVQVVHSIASAVTDYANVTVVLLLAGPHANEVADALNTIASIVSAYGSPQCTSSFCFSWDHLHAHVREAVQQSIRRAQAIAREEGDPDAALYLLDHSQWKSSKEGTWERFLSQLPGCGPSGAQEILTGWRDSGSDDQRLCHCILDLQHMSQQELLLPTGDPTAGQHHNTGRNRVADFIASQEAGSEYDAVLEIIHGEATALIASSTDARKLPANSRARRPRNHSSALEATSADIVGVTQSFPSGHRVASMAPNREPRSAAAALRAGQRDTKAQHMHHSHGMSPAMAITGGQRVDSSGRAVNPRDFGGEYSGSSNSQAAQAQRVRDLSGPVRGSYSRWPGSQNFPDVGGRAHHGSSANSSPLYPVGRAPARSSVARGLGRLMRASSSSIHRSPSERRPAVVYPDVQNEHLNPGNTNTRSPPESPAAIALLRARTLTNARPRFSASGALRGLAHRGQHIISMPMSPAQQERGRGGRDSRGTGGGAALSFGKTDHRSPLTPTTQPISARPEVYGRYQGSFAGQPSPIGSRPSTQQHRDSIMEHSQLSRVRTASGSATPEEVERLKNRRLTLGAGAGGSGQTKLSWS